MVGFGSIRKMRSMDLADELAETLDSLIASDSVASIALSGGSSPIGLYQDLSKKAIDWHRVKVTLIDDRKVPADHQDSNQLLLKETLFQDKAARAKFVSLEEWPINQSPNIGILGMGEDGHFASLFPAMLDIDLAFNPEAKPKVISTAPMGNPKVSRFTMNLSMILGIQTRILLIVGERKKSTLQKALAGFDLPITRLLDHDGTRIVYGSN